VRERERGKEESKNERDKWKHGGREIEIERERVERETGRVKSEERERM
jgi:hypothetical protein